MLARVIVILFLDEWRFSSFFFGATNPTSVPAEQSRIFSSCQHTEHRCVFIFPECLYRNMLCAVRQVLALSIFKDRVALHAA